MASSGVKANCDPAGDSSLTVSEYVVAGFSPVESTWDAKDYHSAIRILRGMPYSSLPQFRSARSGPLFNKLIDSEKTVLALIFEDSFSGPLVDDVSADQVGSLDDLYTRAWQDGIDVDCEIVVVRLSRLEGMVGFMPTVGEQDLLVEDLQRSPGRLSGDGNRAVDDELIVRLRAGGAAASQRITAEIARTMKLLAEPHLSDQARGLFAEMMSVIVPLARDRLTRNDSVEVASWLQTAATTPVNSLVASELLAQSQVLRQRK